MRKDWKLQSKKRSRRANANSRSTLSRCAKEPLTLSSPIMARCLVPSKHCLPRYARILVIVVPRCTGLTDSGITRAHEIGDTAADKLSAPDWTRNYTVRFARHGWHCIGVRTGATGVPYNLSEARDSAANSCPKRRNPSRVFGPARVLIVERLFKLSRTSRETLQVPSGLRQAEPGSSRHQERLRYWQRTRRSYQCGQPRTAR
jgi:hypothetical protein